MSHDAIQKVFDEWAKSGRADGMEEGHGDVVRQVIEKMEIKPGQQILDLGCGHGWATRLLGQTAPGAQAIGIDASSAMIEVAESRHDFTARARYERGVFEEIDFKDGKFDHIFSMEALYYAVDLDKALSEMLRVLKPGGSVDIVVDRFKESPHTEAWADQVGVQMHFLGESEWAAAFEGAGFSDVSTERVIDSRGPGSEADFEPSEHCSSFEMKRERHEAGSLHIHATKPA